MADQIPTPPAPEMVERVARTIWRADPNAGEGWQWLSERQRSGYLGQARAAIEAMREPTKAMVSAAYSACGCDEAYRLATPADHWHAMIDAALGK